MAGYELFYSCGGHGGPHHGIVSAIMAAKRLIRGSRSIQWIEVRERCVLPFDRCPVAATVTRQGVINHGDKCHAK